MKRDKPSALEAVEACLAAIKARDGELHAWTAVDARFARRQARELDKGPARGPLQGIPVGVKDIFDTADLPTEYGSPIYKGHRPAADAACVAAARAAGAVIIGKTVTTEFATMVPAATVHPRDPGRTPGGSSSGSAAAVAAGMVRFAYGTQTVGSIIRPAAYCGVVGYKPSYGMLSRSGMKMGAESLDTPGVIARNVADAALLAGASAVQRRPPRVCSVLQKPLLGLCRSPNWQHMSREGARCLRDRGGTPGRQGRPPGGAGAPVRRAGRRGIDHPRLRDGARPRARGRAPPRAHRADAAGAHRCRRRHVLRKIPTGNRIHE